MRKILPLLLTVLLVTCNLPAPSPEQATAAPATEAPYQPCSYQWATQPLPEVSAKVQSAMQAAGLENVTATAEAYGETCSTSLAAQTPTFAAMETDFRVTVEVASLSDREEMGNLAEKILVVLDGFPVGTTPGPQPGYVGISFTADADQLNLWFLASDGRAARDRGLRGAALLEELLNK
ncbi:MAG TPA: hypothetical protein VMC09_07670 [Anaerolineales bacterium]|nr:hypothetical protein [Anaerolineales bacterium]